MYEREGGKAFSLCDAIFFFKIELKWLKWPNHSQFTQSDPISAFWNHKEQIWPIKPPIWLNHYNWLNQSHFDTQIDLISLS